MDIYEQITNALKAEWKSGRTQQEIADRAGLTNQHVNNLLSGKRRAESMKLETLLKLFPHAQIDLQGAQLAGDHAVQIQGGNSGTVNSAVSREWAVDRILADSELTDAEKIKIIRVLRK